MRLAHLLSIALVAASSMQLASAQTFPNQLIRIVCSEVSGLNDQAARLFAPGLSEALGQPVIVVNLSAPVREQTVLKAEPDGHTLYVSNAGVWTQPLVRKMHYETKDFSLVTMLAREPHVVVVTPSLPVKSVKELIALAKARPGELNQSVGSIGGPNHLAMELFMAMTGTKIMAIVYKSQGQELAELMSGQVQLTYMAVGEVAPHIKTGRLRALAVTTLQPTALAPGLPPVADALPGFQHVAYRVAYVRAGTPPAIIARLNQEIVRVISRPDVKQKFFDKGSDVVGNSPEQAAEEAKSDLARWSKVVKDAGIKVE